MSEVPQRRPPSSNTIPGVDTRTTPVAQRFDPPLKHKPYEVIVEEVDALLRDVESRRYGKRRGAR